MRHEMRAVLPETDHCQAGDGLFKIAPGASLYVAPHAKRKLKKCGLAPGGLVLV